MNERKVPVIGWRTTAAPPANVLTAIVELDGILLLELVVTILDVTDGDTAADEVADD